MLSSNQNGITFVKKRQENGDDDDDDDDNNDDGFIWVRVIYATTHHRQKILPPPSTTQNISYKRWSYPHLSSTAKDCYGYYQGIYQYIKKRTISYPKKLRVNIVLQRSVSNWNWYKKKDMETITYVQDM